MLGSSPQAHISRSSEIPHRVPRAPLQSTPHFSVYPTFSVPTPGIQRLLGLLSLLPAPISQVSPETEAPKLQRTGGNPCRGAVSAPYCAAAAAAASYKGAASSPAPCEGGGGAGALSAPPVTGAATSAFAAWALMPFED